MSDPKPHRVEFHTLPWRDRLAEITRSMRHISNLRDPMQMTSEYGSWIRSLQEIDAFVSISRRDLIEPWYRITRSTLWKQDINPWKEKHRLPLLDRGLLGQLIYAEEARIINDLKVEPNDPAYEYIGPFRSLQAVPMFEDGKCLNMTIVLRKECDGFDPNRLPELVWQGNLFGRATRNLVLSDELAEAYRMVDRELRVVADIQRSLLPTELPQIPGLEFATHYQTSTQAGGDYYDFFPLDDGRLGILIADVSGHGTPAAVMMAVTHSIAHTRDGPPAPPCKLLDFINQRLCARYTTNGTFVTAFYGIYDPATRTLDYCTAGHNPPIVRTACTGRAMRLDQNGGLPLGIETEAVYDDTVVQLSDGDVLVLYTDGITEARKPTGEFFGTEQLEALIDSCATDAASIVKSITKSVDEWTNHAPANDDRTLVVARLNCKDCKCT